MIAGVIKRQGDVGRGIKEESLGRIFASGDGLAHIFQIEVLNGGVEQDLTGCSVQGYFIRSADDTVLITGSADGSVATVVLPAACYAVYGPFKLIIRVVNGNTRSTVYVASGYVTRSSTDTIIDPGHVIPDITELLAQIDAMERATAAAEAAATKAVRYDSAQSLQDAEKGTARTNIDAVSSAELATVSGDVADLKSAIDEDVALLDGKIGLANTRITGNATNIGTLQTDMETAQRDIRSLDGEYIDLSARMGMLEPEATEEDVGKALIAKTVNGNKVIEYEFGETTEIDDTAGEGDTDKTWSANKLLRTTDTINTILTNKVSINQGIEHTGKALVVNDDGLVTVGEARITDIVKIALLNIFQHVVYSDDQGPNCYEALRAALNNNEPTPVDYYFKITNKTFNSVADLIDMPLGLLNADVSYSIVLDADEVNFDFTVDSPGERYTLFTINEAITLGALADETRDRVQYRLNVFNLYLRLFTARKLSESNRHVRFAFSHEANSEKVICRFVVDGVEANLGTLIDNNYAYNYTETNDRFIVGARYDEPEAAYFRFFKGVINELIIYNHTMSSEQIDAYIDA